MMISIVQHTARDFDAWKAVFDEQEATRRRHGATGRELYRGFDDRHEVTVVNHFATKEQAEAFASDPPLKEAMECGGVISEPRITWAQEAAAAENKAKAA